MLDRFSLPIIPQQERDGVLCKLEPPVSIDCDLAMGVKQLLCAPFLVSVHDLYRMYVSYVLGRSGRF